MKKNFIISTDSCVDDYKSRLAENGIHCIILRRVLNGKEMGELYDSAEEFEAFYEELKNGAMPTTTQLNPFELQEYFEGILAAEPQGDLIHISLSSGLSATCSNAKKAAETINQNLKGRRVYVIDSLIATHAQSMLVDRLTEMRDSGVSSVEAIKRIEDIRDHQQAWLIMSDLFHLKRGGRISGFQATVGSILGIKPIITLTKDGKLAIENKMRGSAKAIEYLLSKMNELGEKVNKNFIKSTIYFVRTSASKLYDEFKTAVLKKYPNISFVEKIVGPIIGTHVGGGSAMVLFEGAERLDIQVK